MLFYAIKTETKMSLRVGRFAVTQSNPVRVGTRSGMWAAAAVKVFILC